MRSCYVASPLGFTAAGRLYNETVLLPALAAVVEPVDPWSFTGDGDIGARNIAAIRDCELLVAVLDGQELDSGTVAELGYAAGLGLPCFGLRSDLRQTGEAGFTVNLQVAAFVAASGGTIETTLDALVERLRG